MPGVTRTTPRACGRSEEALRAFATSGVHLDAMKVSARLAATIRTHTYEAAELPAWPDARRLLADDGRAIHFERPARQA